jgi:hypothetical protein
MTTETEIEAAFNEYKNQCPAEAFSLRYSFSDFAAGYLACKAYEREKSAAVVIALETLMGSSGIFAWEYDIAKAALEKHRGEK